MPSRERLRDMLKGVLTWVRILTSTRDNKTPDVIRIGGILLGTQFLVLAGWDIAVHGHPFDPMNYGTGAAALLTAIGAALRLKKCDEPSHDH